MREYLLSSLETWVRTAAGDAIKSTTDTLQADGTSRLSLTNSGYLVPVSVRVDAGSPLQANQYSFEDNVLVLTNPPTAGSSVYATYRYARYNPTEILQFITNGAKTVKGNLNAAWRVDSAGEGGNGQSRILDEDQGFYDDQGDPKTLLERMIVLQSCLEIYTAQASSTANDAIMIRDGDTTIDTSKTAAATQTILAALQRQYEHNMQEMKMRNYTGRNSSNL